ncbi:MAG: hypothetical protein M3381_11710 [Actinomycetota bacterium]|nr:hypothetical protein [Actinomycetota bacterium]
MAIYVVYRKSKETETQVTYQYGHGENEMDMTLVIDKANPTVAPKEGPYDPIAQKVIGQVNSRREGPDQWPGGGAIQR